MSSIIRSKLDIMKLMECIKIAYRALYMAWGYHRRNPIEAYRQLIIRREDKRQTVKFYSRSLKLVEGGK